MAPQKQVREIEIRVNTRGNPEIKKLASEFGKLNKGVRDFSSTLSTLKNAFFAIQGFTFAGIGLSTLTQTADALQKLTDRLTLSEGSLEAANIQLGKLGDVANATNSRIEDVATVYSRLNLSLRDAGVSSEALLATTQALQNTFRLSGATTAEATAATIQLSQGLASGQVRGQELRSVLEQNALVGEILAKKLGIARGELLKFAEKNGGIKASEVLGALADNFKDINDRAGKLQPTIGEGLDKAFNGLKIRLNEVNQEFGLTAKAITGIQVVADNLGLILGTAGLVGSIYVVTKAVAGLTIAFEAVTAVLAGLAYFGVGAVTAAFSAFLVIAAIVVATFGSLYLAIFEADTIAKVLGGTFDSLKETFLELKDALTGSTDASINNIDKINERLQKTEQFAGQAKALLNDISGNNAPLKSIFEADESPIEKQISALKRAADAINANKKEVFDFKKELTLLNALYSSGNVGVSEYGKKLKQLEIKNINKEFEEGSLNLTDYNKKLKEITDGKAVKSSKLLELNLKQLNAEFKSGKVSIDQYVSALNNAEFAKLNRDVTEGKKNILDFQEAVRGRNLEELNKQLAKGSITFSDYREASQGLELGKLNQELQTGVIALTEYDNKVASISDKFQPGSALRSGIQGYLESSGTLSQNIAKSIENTFNRLEDVLFDFIKTGRFQFAQFTQAILDDLAKIIIRAAIIRPLANGILDAAGLPKDTATTKSANGNVFDRGLKKFASGGVVDSPTMFGYGSGKRGLMGEAGPEAILPLKRGPNGKLGVESGGGGAGAVIVNVFNQASGDAEVTQQERTNSDGDRVIDVFIKNRIKQSFSDGSLDKALNSNYGVKRRSN